MSRVNLKQILSEGSVILVKNAHRKIGEKLDIYVQMQFNPANLLIIGEVREKITDF